MRKAFLLISGFIVISLLTASFFWFYKIGFIKTRANTSVESISVDNSYLFVSPLQARANGKERIRLTIFVLNNQGLGVPNKKVFINNTTHLAVESVLPQTDNFGKAVFDISSIVPGEYYLTVEVGGKTLPQKAHLSFK